MVSGRQMAVGSRSALSRLKNWIRVYDARALNCLLPTSFRRGVVVDDAPAGVGAAEDEGEAAVGRVARARELPAARRHDVELAERLELQLREGERAHLLARVVARLV